MSVDVQIPTLGESVSEGVIVRWLKQNGERVATDEPLFELETDKASVEIPAPGPGVVTILAQEGATVHVGDVVARIDGDGAAAAKPNLEGAAPSAPGTGGGGSAANTAAPAGGSVGAPGQAQCSGVLRT
jgi:pyruvate/2-oxoglutarate dehydrogenase complex dihydrolipoamide acyltransferase (E2) component